MSAASSGAETERVSDIDRIIDVLTRFHPRVVGNGWLGRLLERQRIANAIRSERGDLDYCLVMLRNRDGEPDCGMLTTIPKPHADDKFAMTGQAPMLFGFLFGFSNQAQFDAVVQDVLALARERGRLTLVGPFEATINYSCGLLAEEPEFPPGMLMPTNPLQWNDYLPNSGFTLADHLYTYQIDIDQAAFRPIGLRALAKLDMTMRDIHLPVSPEERIAIRDVFNSGWRGNWGFVPIDTGYVDMLVREFWPVLWRGLSWLVYQGERPVGVAIVTPDIEELTRGSPGPLTLLARLWRFFVLRRVRAIRIFILGLSSDIHGGAIAASVVESMIESGKVARKRYRARYLVVGWTLSSNRRINRMIRHWAPDALRVVHSMWTLPVAPSDPSS